MIQTATFREGENTKCHDFTISQLIYLASFKKSLAKRLDIGDIIWVSII